MTLDEANTTMKNHAPRLGDSAYVELKERLTRGIYKPGDKLTVRAIAEKLAVSSTPARDAINRLTSQNALVYAGPKTVIVPILSRQELAEITLIRIALEGLAAERAAAHCRPEDINKLLEIQYNINSALETSAYGDALWHNKEFHFLIYKMSGLPHLLELIEGQWLRIGPSFFGLYPEFAEARYGVRNHEMAIDALNEKDGSALRAAIENDIRDGFRRLKVALLCES